MASNGNIWRIARCDDNDGEHAIFVVAETITEAIVAALPSMCEGEISSVSRVGHVLSITPAVVKAWSEARGR